MMRKMGAGERKQLPGISSKCTSFYDGGFKTNIIIMSFSKKQEYELPWVKLVIILKFL